MALHGQALLSFFAGFAFLAQVVRSEIRNYDVKLPPTSNEIHYSMGFIVAPGLVDLSNLLFDVDDNGHKSPKKQGGDEQSAEAYGDDDDSLFGTQGKNNNNNDDGGRYLYFSSLSRAQFSESVAAELQQDDRHSSTTLQQPERRKLDDASLTWSAIDIVLFWQPDTCVNTRLGCDWTELGVGKTHSGGVEWCCSQRAAQRNLCPQKNGRLLIDEEKFKGERRSVPYPPTGISMSPEQMRVKSPVMPVTKETGSYVLIFANCDDGGRPMTIRGSFVFQSKHGFLPGHLFGKLYFFVAVAFIYLVALLWYGISMRVYRDSAIPIQKWVLLTIGVGMLEVIFALLDLLIWNMNGARMKFVVFPGIIVGVLKRGVSRCLIVMVSLGWGVVRDRLEQLRCVMALCLLYIVAASTRDIVAEIVSLNDFPVEVMAKLVTVMAASGSAVLAIDVAFYVWILVALKGTIRFLAGMNQTTKLRRFSCLRCILLPYMIFAVIWTLFGYANTRAVLLTEDKNWVLGAAFYLNYLLVLITVAILWRPNPTAKDFAFVMELPSVGHDRELDVNAIDTADEADDYHDSVDGNEDGLKIESAVIG